jgi:hypothetical protein
MKNVVRAFVLSLVVTGAFASTHINNSATAVSGKVSAMPIPLCPPDGSTDCGLCKASKCVIE